MDFGCSSYGMWGFGFGGMWFFGIIIWLLAIVALVLFIIWLLKQINKK